jgi:hypothetical protein
MPGFNPLDTEALTRAFIAELTTRDCVPLPKVRRENVSGTGLYALYYSGDFDIYQPISLDGCGWPIYLGSALPRGGRTGEVRELSPGAMQPLYDRLGRHFKSVMYAENLEEDRFSARWLAVDEPFIILGEILLLRWYRPLWNAKVSGFGSKVVGGQRTTGRRSRWDTLHPGRSGTGQREGRDVEVIRAEVRDHLANFPPRL